MFEQTKPVLNEFCRLMMLLSLLCGAGLSSEGAQSKFPTGAYGSGEFTITFYDDGSHSVSANNEVVVKGSYTVREDQIVLTDKEGRYSCGEAKPGKYRWKAEGKTLKFEKLEDDCEGRASALSGQSWVKR